MEKWLALQDEWIANILRCKIKRKIVGNPMAEKVISTP
jgi:hypothetical protein